MDYILTPLLFVGIMAAVMSVTYPLRLLFNDPRDKSILSITSIVGNTGNLGIPLGPDGIWRSECPLYKYDKFI